MTPDPRLALAYTRPTRVAALQLDGKPRRMVVILADLHNARRAGSERLGVMASPVRLSSPARRRVGVEICVRNPERHCLVIAAVTLWLTSSDSSVSTSASRL